MYDSVARLIQAQPDEIALVQSATAAWNVGVLDPAQARRSASSPRDRVHQQRDRAPAGMRADGAYLEVIDDDGTARSTSTSWNADSTRCAVVALTRIVRRRCRQPAGAVGASTGKASVLRAPSRSAAARRHEILGCDLLARPNCAAARHLGPLRVRRIVDPLVRRSSA